MKRNAQNSLCPKRALKDSVILYRSFLDDPAKP